MRSHVLFDASFYRSQVHDLAWDDSAWEHYVEIGAARGIRPSPYFDVPWYRLLNPDLDEFGGNVVEHYERIGGKGHREPHPLFRSHWYWEKYLAGTAAAEHDPLVHYAEIGWKLGHQPHPLFWTDWYAGRYLADRMAGIDPFFHYVTEGASTHQPNPLFEPQIYRDSVAEPGRIAPDPISHYAHVGWREGTAVHPLFDADHFLRQLGLELESLDVSPLEYFLTRKHEADPHLLFSNSHYRKQLRCSGVSCDDQVPLLVYLERGWADLVDPHPLFSKSYYYEHSPDVQEHRIDALKHYVMDGWHQRRPVHPLFNVQFYCEAVGRKDIRPLEHYLTEGSQQGIAVRGVEIADTAPRSLPSSRVVVDVSTTSAWDANAGAGRRIGVFVHAFYPELIADVLERTNHIPGETTLYISTDSTAKASQIRAVCELASKHQFEIRVMVNRGRDIAPWLVGFADRLRQVDYGLHLHTKRSKHYSKQFSAWRTMLFDSNAGSEELVRNILSLLDREKIGMVAPDHFYPIRSLIQWGGNFEVSRALIRLMGEDIDREEVLDFPSGSMFWFKTDALRPLLDLDLSLHHFDAEAGQVDGTLAHAIERTLFTIGAIAGYEYVITNSVSHSAEPPEFPSNLYHPTRAGRGVEGDHFPETTNFVARPSTVPKPRFNLLIPTVDRAVGYAGVSSALDVYEAVRAELGSEFDGRMIATDVSPGNQFAPPKGYAVRNIVEADVVDQDSVTDAAVRYRAPIFIRENDFFMATAWWTAHNAFDLTDQQARMFGGDPHRITYLIQDNENGFYPWSTKYVMCDGTYRAPERTIPVFNTELLFEDFKSRGYFNDGIVYQPGINRGFLRQVVPGKAKEKIVLLYGRPHAERNCLPFLDMVVETLVRENPTFWADWRFCAIGEDFERSELRGRRIEILGRLSLDEYAELSSRSALAISLMVSPHPSYPPLEMAEAGVRVLANTYDEKDLSELHENITSFDRFHVPSVAQKLTALAENWLVSPQSGWEAKARVGWFFGGHSNLQEVASKVAEEVRNEYRRSQES